MNTPGTITMSMTELDRLEVVQAVAVLRLQVLEFELMRDQMGYTALEREAAR
jgi:hypothetical protein